VSLPPLAPGAWLRWELVSRLLPGDEHGVRDVLEVGCGLGGFAARLVQRYRYVGLEPDPASHAVASRRLAAAGGVGEIRKGDLSALAPDEKFDLVCAFEVLEHIEDDEKALAEWVGHLRPGGWLLISTPAFQRRMGPWDEIVGHYRRYDPPVMAQLLREAGLQDVLVRRFGGPLGYALETARNVVGRRRTSRGTQPSTSMEHRTAGSGRQLQPDSAVQGLAARFGTLPFRLVDRAFPGHGPSLLARARLPRHASP
jgi:SAM-dependent methyltransferase